MAGTTRRGAAGRASLDNEWAAVEMLKELRAAGADDLVTTLATRVAAHTSLDLSQQAAQLLVSSGIEHLIVDVPSIDRAQDEGRLTAHRIFFGLPRTSVARAARASTAV